MEPWERVWIDADTYSQDLHSNINCTDCHGGQAVDDMAAAHEGMVASPAADAEATCGSCHTDLTTASMFSLHSTLEGYDTVLYERSSPEHYDALEEMEQNHCNSCHTTCGDCHVSQPTSVGGGLLSGHSFVGSPPMSQTCTACHGSRVKNEYYGLNEGIASDVHFRARMACVDCHTDVEIHGVGVDADHRYAGTQDPTCESCHQEQIGVGSGILEHEVHGTETLSCQSCHSTTYTNCINCHVEQTDDGVPFYTIEEHFFGFYLGLNPNRSAERPYEYVPLRHVPIDRDSFSFYGEDLLPNFDSRPTWVYATPHNIQRRTPQTENCTACHDNDTYFLTQAVLASYELAANRSVASEPPPLPDDYEQLIAGRDGGESAQPAPAGDGFWGEEPEADPQPSGDDGGFWGEEPEPANETEDSFWGGESAPAEPTPEESFWGEEPVEPNESEPETGDAFWGS